jgi:hypothetical protein
MQKGLHNKIKPCGGYWDHENASQSRRAALEVMSREEIQLELDGIIAPSTEEINNFIHEKHGELFKDLSEV